MIDIVPADTKEMLEPLRSLFAEFADESGADLRSEEFLLELVGLPGDYRAPGGRLLAVFEAAHLVGCGAFRDAGEGACEIRRVYVREEYRDAGVERRLLSRLLEEARASGYGSVYYDPDHSIPTAEDAAREIGFIESPGVEAPFLRLDL